MTKLTHNGHSIEATLDGATVTISQDGVWAGTGRWADGEILDCAAVLGDDPESQEDVYAALADGLSC